MRVNKSFYISCIASRTACINCQVYLIYIYIYIYIHTYFFKSTRRRNKRYETPFEKCETVFKDRLQNPLSKGESLSWLLPKICHEWFWTRIPQKLCASAHSQLWSMRGSSECNGRPSVGIWLTRSQIQVVICVYSWYHLVSSQPSFCSRMTWKEYATEVHNM